MNLTLLFHSIVIGISELSEEEKMNLDIEEMTGDDIHPLARQLGGVRSMDPETGKPGGCIYYLGIIDILIHYNTRKAAETQLKGAMGQDRQKISAVPPDFYAQRFKEFMFKHMQGVDPK